MKQTLTATYRQGVFYPNGSCDMPDGAIVEVTELPSGTRPPTVADPDERRKIAKRIARDILENPLGLGHPKLTREQMHERR